MSEFFLQRYRQIDPDVTLVEPSALKTALRVNMRRTTPQQLVRDLNARAAFVSKIPFLRHAFYATASFSLGTTAECLLGHYYIQAPLSQLACEVLDPPAGATVLDMAAAPGSKATYLAEMVTDTGVVIALDRDAMRLSAVRNNAERLGLPNILCVKKDSRFAPELGMRFSHVLLDAPCSGNFCSEDGWCDKRTLEDIKRNARTQRELLTAAVRCLAPGGTLLYSTCSLEPEEDELQVDTLLRKYPDLDVLPIDVQLGDAGVTRWDGKELDPRVARTKRFWPHKTGCEGFYMALLRNSSGS